jgi:hypothetical protein
LAKAALRGEEGYVIEVRSWEVRYVRTRIWERVVVLVFGVSESAAGGSGWDEEYERVEVCMN